MKSELNIKISITEITDTLVNQINSISSISMDTIQQIRNSYFNISRKH